MACSKQISFLMLAMIIFLSSSKRVAAGRNLEAGTPHVLNSRLPKLTPALPEISNVLPETELLIESDIESKPPVPSVVDIPVSEIQPLSGMGIRSSVDLEAESPDVLYFELPELAPSFPEIPFETELSTESKAESTPPLPTYVEIPVPEILPDAGPVPSKIAQDIA